MSKAGMSPEQIKQFMLELRRPFRTDEPEPQPEYSAAAVFWAGINDDGMEDMKLLLALAHERRLVNELLRDAKALAEVLHGMDGSDFASTTTGNCINVGVRLAALRATIKKVEGGT